MSADEPAADLPERGAGVRRWRAVAVTAAVLVAAAAGTGAALRDRGGYDTIEALDDALLLTGPDGTRTLADLSELVTTRYGPDTKILLHDSHVYAAELPAGTITRLDPTTGDSDGTPWTAGGPLADAAIDATGTIYALRIDGNLQALTWNATTLAAAHTPTRVPGTGPRSALVAHDHDVTTLVPENSTAVHDRTPRPVPGLTGQILPAELSPPDLIPVTLDGTTILLIVTDIGTRNVDASLYKCDRPGRPATHATHIYLPCRGTGTIIALDQTGHHQPPDITLGRDGDPILTLHNGRLHAWLPGGDSIIINPDGSTQPAPPPTAAPNPKPTTSPATPRPPNTRPTEPPTNQPTIEPPPLPATSPIATISTPPGAPADGDPLIAIREEVDVSSYSCAGYLCTQYTYSYTVVLDPPQTWSALSGPCILRQVHSDTGIDAGTWEVGCGLTIVGLGLGDGNQYTFWVDGCDFGECVATSASVTKLLRRSLVLRSCRDGYELCVEP